MRTKATGLCAKSRRTVDGGVFRVIFNIIVRMPELKMLENILKPKETPTVHAKSTFREDWDEIGSIRAKKGHLVLESTIFSKLVGYQCVKHLP